MIVDFLRRRTVAVFLCGSLATAAGEGLAGQAATVAVGENFRAEPNGTLLGRLRAGAALDVLDVSDSWLQFDLDGWVWERSLQVTSRSDFDLVVSEPGGENIRATPAGDIVGRLEQGTLLREIERVPGWIRVRRRSWVWGPSVELGAPVADRPPPRAEAARGEQWLTSDERAATILSAPNGDTVATTVSGANLRLLAREGNWARVRIDGWTWLPEGSTEARDTIVITDVDVSDVTAAPSTYRGRVLQLDLQFISLERAGRIRTDFYEGEPFLLTQAGRREGIFVYVAIPPERLGEAEGLSPLEGIRVIGRVRTGASALTGSPILELLSLATIAR